MKNILIINGHPNPHSFCYALANSYYEGALESAKSVRLVHLTLLQFNPILEYGYSSETELEPDLVEFQQEIENADHLVFIYPNWWGTMPALLKGFIDRVFLPGFAFKYQEKSPFPKKLLTGKSARVFVTMDTPPFIYKWFYRAPGHDSFKNRVLKFSGIKPVSITSFGSIRSSTDLQRKKWLKTTKKMGIKMI